MADVSEVPIVEVHLGNYRELWPGLLLAVQSASFVAIDTVKQSTANLLFSSFISLLSLSRKYRVRIAFGNLGRQTPVVPVNHWSKVLLA